MAMAILSPARKNVSVLQGLKLINRGKVRDTYEINDRLLLIVVTDAVSVFDFVLSDLVPMKGIILNALSHFWFDMLESEGFKTHMVAVGVDIDEHLPWELRNNRDLQSRAMVVWRFNMEPRIEHIARNCLTGSGLEEYKKTGTVCGVQLQPGLQDGDLLPSPLYTPTTKSDEGHDEAIDAQETKAMYPDHVDTFMRAFAVITKYARERGIVVADGKGELADNCSIADEFGTPDSCRFWDALAWEKSRTSATRKAPQPFDKQFVRSYALERGLSGKLTTDDPNNIELAHSLELPGRLIRATTQTYRYIFWRLTGKTIEQYLRAKFGVPTEPLRKKVTVVFGSESDVPAVAHHLKQEWLSQGISKLNVHVISCHRNPEQLERFAESGTDGSDAVIAAGGMAFALPGVLDALLYSKGKDIPVVGVALGKPESVSLLAATLSIEQLPEQPVVIDEMKGTAYWGPDGFAKALHRVGFEELPPPKMRPKKEPVFNVDLSKY
jgi:phosphoribosylaminoimidazole-succinocarboxamide synthase